MSRTALVPGWYIEYLAALLRQAPRPDEIDQATAEGWTKNQKVLKKALAEVLLPPKTNIVADEKFELMKEFDVTIPENYVHANRLALFKKQHRSEFYGWNDSITDENFSKVTTQLVPGKKFKVKVFRQIVSGSTTSEERMTFLRSQKAVFVGAQGASLVYEQVKGELPKGYGYVSFDEKDALLADDDGYHRVPSVSRNSDGDWIFNLGRFEGVWFDDGCLVCFCDLSA